ncbi:PilZ domain-containing protein [Ureibacillus sp. GCM10028918]|uniref:PilZ domain-containing protein n=1 Tax=Ureibacillus sp. GCM10028918 TaxID=3273429 RepID=UPI003612D3F1
MHFKRQEGFRFVFNEPIEASFRLLVNGQPVEALGSCPGQILDVSPRGVKMFSEVKFGEYLNKATLQVELQFVLDVTTIQAVGEIVWRKPFGRGNQYGILFQAQKNIDELIISEMKLRRKKEVLQSKQNR